MLTVECTLTPLRDLRSRRNPGNHIVREPALVTVAHLFEFDEIIDARSEREFAADHVPGAINCPVLDDEERALVGTIYKERSPFEARKIGSALVGGNIARHLRERFLDRPRTWRPLVYCWRGDSAARRSRTCSPRSVGTPAGSRADIARIAAR